MNTDYLSTMHVNSFPGLRPLYLILFFVVLTAPPHSAHAGDIFAGKTLYQSYCETCHGSDGAGAMPGTPDFKRGKGLMQPDRSIFNVIWNGKNSMPGFRGVMEEEEVFDIVSFLRTFF